jgi:hypothetical protein
MRTFLIVALQFVVSAARPVTVRSAGAEPSTIAAMMRGDTKARGASRRISEETRRQIAVILNMSILSRAVRCYLAISPVWKCKGSIAGPYPLGLS